MFVRYWAFLLARRCEFDSSARVLLQLWEHGGGSDVTSDRITHFLILSLDSGHARSWSRSGHELAASDVHDCTVGVASCPDISPLLPSLAACRRNWDEYTGGSLSQAIASAATAARSILAKVPLPPHLLLTTSASRAPQALLAQRRLSVNGNSSRRVACAPFRALFHNAPQGWARSNYRHGGQCLVLHLLGQYGAGRAAAAAVVLTLSQIGSIHAHEPDVNIVIYDLGAVFASALNPNLRYSCKRHVLAGFDALQRQVARSWRQVQVLHHRLIIASPHHRVPGVACSSRPPPPPARLQSTPLRLETHHHEVQPPSIASPALTLLRHALRRSGTFFYEDAGQVPFKILFPARFFRSVRVCLRDVEMCTQEIRGGLGPVLRLIKVSTRAVLSVRALMQAKRWAVASPSAAARRLLLRHAGRKVACKSDACR
jgi:hypothetical protein